MDKESSIERAVVKWAKSHGIQSIKMESSSQIGLPDRMFLLPGGRPLFVEFKTPRGRVSKIQEVVIKKLQDLEYKVHIVRDTKTGIDLIKQESL